MEKLLNKRLIMLAFGILMSCAVFGQQVRVSGTVTDAADGSTLPGVNVLVKGTLTGAITGTNGEYSLMAKPGDILVFSFIGYLPQEITLGNETTVNVALRTDVKALEEVVVIGYGTVRKDDATGSVKAIGSEYFNPGVVSSPQEMVIGKMAGVQITTGGGAPGDGATIRIRGGSSLSASNDPLIVIDGVAIDNITGVNGMRNPLSTINPNDIETFTVLKDASATAIYGSRASNGVIIVTTKKGASGKPFSVSYNGTVSVSTPANYVDVFTADEFRDIVETKYASSANVISLLGDATTDWQKEIYQTAIAHDHNLSFTGGLGNFPYRASLGYTNQDGILKTDNLERFTGAINISPSLFDDHLKIDINAKAMRNNNRFANTGAIGAAVSMDPTQAKDFIWLYNGIPDMNATFNPLVQLNDQFDKAGVNRFIGNVMLEYKLHFLPDLKAKLNLGLDQSDSHGTVVIPVGSMLSYSTYEGNGRETEWNQNKKNSLLDFYFDYNKEIGTNSRLNAMVGYSWQHFYRNENTYTYVNNGGKIVENNDIETENYLVSFFGRVNYILMDRYLFTVTVRDDGSSRFAPQNRWGLFPSAAFAWHISKEGFFSDKVVSNLKLRLGYGITGQQNLTSNDYPYQSVYQYSETGGSVQMGDNYYQTIRASGYDENIKWEETTTYNVGLDYGFFDDRITGDLDVYYRETNDLINEIPVPAGTNLKNFITTNVGSLTNKGVEFSINGKVISNTNMDWELGFNATYNVNEITKLTKVDDPNYDGVVVGSIGGGTGNNIQIHSVGFPAYSFYALEQVYGSDGKPIENLFVDRDGDGSVTTSGDKYRYQKPAPTVFMGFSSLFRYKNFDFSFNGRISLGNYIYNNVNAGQGVWAYMASPGRYLQNRVRNVEYTDFVNPRYFSDYYIENGSFLKLDNLSVGYNFKNLFDEKVNLRVYGTAQNLFTVTKYSGLDPEVFNGIDNNVYPRPRIFLLGVNITY